MIYTAEKVEDILRESGFKITSQRAAILDTITHSREHLTPAAIHEKVCREHAGIGLVTVYRTLEMLAKLGLICEMHAGGSCRSYLMRRPSGHHHHLICSDCGRVIEFEAPEVMEVVQSLVEREGVQVDDVHLFISGRCAGCRQDVEMKT